MPTAQGTASRAQRGLMIRQATAADAEFIRQLAPRFGGAGAPTWRDAEKLRAFHEVGVEQAVAHLHTPEEGHMILLAADKAAQPLGFIHLHGERSVLTGEEQGYVAMLAVAASAEGHGVGRGLLAAGERWARARGYRHLALDTFADNAHARAVYRHLGFAEESLKLVKVL